MVRPSGVGRGTSRLPDLSPVPPSVQGDGQGNTCQADRNLPDQFVFLKRTCWAMPLSDPSTSLSACESESKQGEAKSA